MKDYLKIHDVEYLSNHLSDLTVILNLNKGTNQKYTDNLNKDTTKKGTSYIYEKLNISATSHEYVK